MAATAEGNALSRADQDKMCRSKRRFRREQDAIMFVARARARGGYARGARVYRCPVCAHYHVADRPKAD